MVQMLGVCGVESLVMKNLCMAACIECLHSRVQHCWISVNSLNVFWSHFVSNAVA